MLSVLIATHNGADTIGRTFEAMHTLIAPEGGWELIVVNNASTDRTKDVIRDWQDRLPLTYLEEPRLGKSFAINRALEASRGDLIVMTDDDVLPNADWLTEWHRVAKSFPDCSVFGGAIIPEFGALPPDYVPKYWYGVLYGASPQYKEGPLEPRENGLFDISGGNFAIRRSVYNDGALFDQSFQIGLNGLMGEDTEFVRRLGTSRYKVCFTPNAGLRHIIHNHQASWRWIHHRFYRHGRCMFTLLETRWNPSTQKREFKFPWSRFRSATGSFLRLLLATLRSDKSASSKQSIALAYDLGAIHQALILLRQKKRTTGP